MIKTEEKGIIQLNTRLKGIPKKAIPGIVTRAATFFEREAKQNMLKHIYKRLTGKSRQSIIRQPLTQTSQKVYMGVNYGKYLEFGTGIHHSEGARKPWFTKLSNITGNSSDDDKIIRMVGMKPRPFWKPARESTKSSIPDFAKQELSKV